MYDVAIIGAGPAGMSAALTLKLHDKSIVWFGSRAMSEKIEKSDKIANYPGLGTISGVDLNARFLEHAEELGLELTDKKVTDIMPNKNGFMILADNEVFEAKKLLLAIGYVAAKGFEGEDRLLGRGVSYCATCDGMFYKGKTIAVFCGDKRYEHEVKGLSEIASKIYLFTPYKGASELDEIENIERLTSPIKVINGEMKADSVTLADGTEVVIDGIFILRNAIAPATILKGLELDGPHIKVDRSLRTNIDGCFAAGDCTGRPYQIAIAVGEGNLAAHNILEELGK